MAGNVYKDFNLMLWRFKYHITKNKTVKKSHGLIKFMRYVHMHILRAIYCTPLHAAAILCVFAEIYSTEEGESSPESSLPDKDVCLLERKSH